MENEKLILIRKTLGLTQQEFALKLGLARSSLSEIENGNINVTKRVKLLLYSAYHINPSWFENNEGEMFIEVNHYYQEFFEIFEKLSLPLQKFLIDTAKHLLDIQDDL